MMQFAGYCGRLALMVAVVVAKLQLTGADCLLDKSVSDKDRPEQERLLHTLKPIMGKSSEALKDSFGNSYKFVVCGDINGTENVSLALFEPDKNPVALGYNNQTVVSSDNFWLMLTFLGGAKTEDCESSRRQGQVLFLCDHKQDKIDMKIPYESPATKSSSLFIVRHKSICSLSEGGGLSGGAIFFILLLVTFGAYFTFGFCYLRLVKGAKGIEQIPNRSFWFRIGNLMADGCNAVCRCDQYCGGERPPSSHSGYSPIDERLAQDWQGVDRDAALLSP